MTSALAAVTEAQFARQVVALAALCGWLCHHQRPARTARGWRSAIQGHAGWPDLVLCHPKRGLLLVVELKVGRGKATAGQDAWLAALRGAGVYACVWRPEDWPAIERLLKGED